MPSARRAEHGSAIVADSSLLIEHLRGNAKATRFLEREAARGKIIVPALVAWELWKGATTPARSAAVESLLEGLDVDPFMPAMARLAAELHRAARDAGRERPAYDPLIAAHALHHGCPLATLDRDYDEIEGLHVLSME